MATTTASSLGCLGVRLVVGLPNARLVVHPDCVALASLDRPTLLAPNVHEHLAGAADLTPEPASRGTSASLHAMLVSQRP